MEYKKLQGIAEIIEVDIPWNRKITNKKKGRLDLEVTFVYKDYDVSLSTMPTIFQELDSDVIEIGLKATTSREYTYYLDARKLGYKVGEDIEALLDIEEKICGKEITFTTYIFKIKELLKGTKYEFSLKNGRVISNCFIHTTKKVINEIPVSYLLRNDDVDNIFNRIKNYVINYLDNGFYKIGKTDEDIISYNKYKELKMNNKVLLDNLRSIPDFPKKGINFRDVTTLYKSGECMQIMLDELYDIYKDKGITKIVGIESRGFVMAAALAGRLGCGVVLARKPGKLPATTIKETFSKEYGVDTIEMHIDAISENDVVLIHDDLLATGGTAKAAYKLVQHFHPKKTYINFIIEIKDEGLHGRDLFEGIDLTTLLTI